MKEDVLICGNTGSLVGVLTRPDPLVDNQDLPAVIMVNAGLVHRVGPNRIYVTIARALARRGFNVLRLDLSGIGDSMPRAGSAPLPQSMLADVRDAMDALASTHGARRFILAGHCSGALLSLFLIQQDPRIVAAVMINPQSGGDEWAEFDRQRKEATYYAHFYGREALMNRQRLRKLLTGKADYRTIFGNVVKFVLVNRLSTLKFRARALFGKYASTASNDRPSEQDQMRNALRAASDHGKLLFIYTEGSTGYQHLRTSAGDDLDRLQTSGAVQIAMIPEADHIFTLLASQQRLVEVIEAWTSNFAAIAQPA